MSIGSDNFYTSEQVTQQPVTFKNRTRWPLPAICSSLKILILIENTPLSWWGTQWGP